MLNIMLRKSIVHNVNLYYVCYYIVICTAACPNVYILSKNKKYSLFLSKSYIMHFSIIRKLTIFVICETSEDNMLETLPPIILRYQSYSSKTGF